MHKNSCLDDANKIGLIADSHGNFKSIQMAVARLNKAHVQTFIHLGDFFDSVENDNLYEIYKVIVKNNMISVKGNNDFQIENQINNGHLPNISSVEKNQILSFLTKMPLLTGNDRICFTHSLPFPTIRSLYEPVDTGTTDRAKQIFDQTTYELIFCGHSHSSILFRWRSGIVSREPIEPGATIHFKTTERYIVIVGSSEKGECGLFERDHMAYHRISTH